MISMCFDIILMYSGTHVCCSVCICDYVYVCKHRCVFPHVCSQSAYTQGSMRHMAWRSQASHKPEASLPQRNVLCSRKRPGRDAGPPFISILASTYATVGTHAGTLPKVMSTCHSLAPSPIHDVCLLLRHFYLCHCQCRALHMHWLSLLSFNSEMECEISSLNSSLVWV